MQWEGLPPKRTRQPKAVTAFLDRRQILVTENRSQRGMPFRSDTTHSPRQCEGLLSVLVGRIEDLTERLNSLEEKLSDRPIPIQQPATDPVMMGELVLDHDARRVTLDGKEVRLSEMMYRLLHELASNGNRVVTYDELLRRTPLGRGCDRNNLKVYIARLRSRLARVNPGSEGMIQSVRGVGYRLVA
jgi:DNA-binding response OmpR family regulator